MAETRSINLVNKIEGGASIVFLSAELPPEKFGIPFAVIRYSLDGETQDYGFRLDLDKQVFLDHSDDVEQEKVFREAAPKIVEVVSSGI